MWFSSVLPCSEELDFLTMAATTGKGDVADYSIKPEAVAPPIPTSEWPLLLKNYDKRMCFMCNLCGGGNK